MSSDEEVYTQRLIKRARISPPSSLSPSPKTGALCTPSPLTGNSSPVFSSPSYPGEKNVGNFSQVSLSSLSSSAKSAGISSSIANFDEFQTSDELAFVRRKPNVVIIKIEFLHSERVNIEQTRYIDSPEMIDIVSDLVRSKSENFRKAVVSKLCESELLKTDIHDYIINRLSKGRFQLNRNIIF